MFDRLESREKTDFIKTLHEFAETYFDKELETRIKNEKMARAIQNTPEWRTIK